MKEEERRVFSSQVGYVELNIIAHHQTPLKLNSLAWSPELLSNLDTSTVQSIQTNTAVASRSTEQAIPNSIYTPSGLGPAGPF